MEKLKIRRDKKLSILVMTGIVVYAEAYAVYTKITLYPYVKVSLLWLVVMLALSIVSCFEIKNIKARKVVSCADSICMVIAVIIVLFNIYTLV